MDSPSDKTSVPELPSGVQLIDSTDTSESLPAVRTDRLYQIAALAAGIILLATAF